MRKSMLHKMISVLLASVLMFLSIPINAPRAQAVAYTGCLSQHDSRWSNYSYGGGTISATGCGILSLVNTVGYLSGEQMNIPSVASWAHSVKGYNVNGANGVWRLVLYPLVEAKYGETYGFTMDCAADGEGYWEGSSSLRLKNHLLNGGVAIGHVPNHFISIVGYNANTNKFHVYDSSATALRGTNVNGGDVWVTQSALATGRMYLDWFVLLSSTEKQETWVEKAAFDVMVYRDRNPDIASMTDAQLKEHWRNHGIKEGRASSTVLDLGFYLANNPDLKAAYGTNYEAVYNHFITSGYKEYRKSSALFDGEYYTEMYPDVDANYGENYMLHYIDHGMSEGRRASLTFDPDYYWHIRPDVYDAWPNDYSMCARHYAGHGINAQIQAYDTVYPVISDVVISDVSADGYTISCKVTDDWKISKVAFPSWSLYNNQDDLADDFLNTQLGVANGDYYTFRVKASDHNNETGLYITHIYAFDEGGNRTQLVLDKVDVNDAIGYITLKDSASCTKEGTYIKNVAVETTVTSLLSQFANENLKVLDSFGNEIGKSTFVGTGATINLYNANSLVESVTVVIMGDVDGNGLVDSTDYSQVKSAFLGCYNLEGFAVSAADVDGNGIVDTTDYMRMRAHFLGTYVLTIPNQE